jgi:hypothetical protein
MPTLQDLIAKGFLRFDAPHMQTELLNVKVPPMIRVSSRVQDLVLGLASYVGESGKHIRISSVLRGTGTSHHAVGRAVDVGNEDIASLILPWLEIRAGVYRLDEVIFDATLAGQADSNRFNLDGGKPHAYSATVLVQHRDHIHLSTLD